MKKFLGIFLACAMCISSPFVYSASTRTIPVYLNGKAIDFSSESVKPQLLWAEPTSHLEKYANLWVFLWNGVLLQSGLLSNVVIQ